MRGYLNCVPAQAKFTQRDFAAVDMRLLANSPFPRAAICRQNLHQQGELRTTAYKRSHIMRYSYVLHFPDNHPPFDKLDCRWQSFLGEFAKPIADKHPNLLFWCSYYGTHASFRVHTDDKGVTDFVERQIQDLGLVFKSEEEEKVTLVGDLGAPRFIDQSLGAAAIAKRADLVLRFLCSTVRLYLDGLVNASGKYWSYPPTPLNENPLGNNFESLAHLVGNISQFEFDVFATAGTAWHQTPLPLPQPIRCRLW